MPVSWLLPLLLADVVGSLSDAPDARLLAAVRSWRKERRLDHETENPNPPRHASVHLFYTSPGDEPVEAWYNEVQVQKSSSVSYFSVMAHAYGYAGIQQVSEEPFTGKVIFSIWDPPACSQNDPNACPEELRANITQCGPESTCTRFGGEGSGAKTFFEWNAWKVQERYQFLVKASPVGTDRVRYTCWFHADAFDWRIVSSIVVLTGGRNWWVHNMYSFVEQWTNAHVGDERWAAYGPAAVRLSGAQPSEWTQLRTARWSHGAAANEDTTHVSGAVSASGERWEMGLGGTLEKSLNVNSELTVGILQTCPTNLVDAVSLEAQSQLPTALPPPVTVSCGGHFAPSCGQCPQGHGAAWCNGECIWDSSGATCVKGSEFPGAVTCGQHLAASCQECPRGHGASWCNGECAWDSATESCKSQARRLVESLICMPASTSWEPSVSLSAAATLAFWTTCLLIAVSSAGFT